MVTFTGGPRVNYSEALDLLPYAATENQREILRSLCETQNAAETGRVMNKDPSKVSRTWKTVRARAARAGWAPEYDMKNPAPDGFRVKGVSTYYDKEGAVRGQWVKTQTDHDRAAEIAQQAVDAICEDIPRLDPLPPPVTRTEVDLLNIYTMTDSHIGMLAWGRETGGEDWDLNIAEDVLTGVFADMVRRAPQADTCVIAQLGDWMHYDSMTPITPTSGHVLDADSRAGKMVAVACRVLRRLVDMALARHNNVMLLVAEGNHDMFGSLMLRTMFRMLYENEPRVTIIESENPYYAYQFGKNMLAWHHGHKRGLDAATALFLASMYEEMWGTTRYRVMHFGDKHHKALKELAGITLEQHGTLAANDAYATRGGWKSHQYAEAITYHRELGEAGRIRSTPAMVGLGVA